MGRHLPYQRAISKEPCQTSETHARTTIMSGKSSGSGPLSDAGLKQIASLAHGNGIDGKKVKLLQAKEGTATLRGQLTIQIAGKVSTKRNVGDPPDGITICGTKHDWQQRAKTASQEAGKDPQLRDQLIDLIMKQPGKGWGFQTDKLKLPTSNVSFGFVQVCDDCHGQGMIICPTCRGESWLPCRPCNARGTVNCTACNRTGQVKTATGTVPCNECRGTGEMQCDQCIGKGRVMCQMCHGKTQIGCDTCQRHGRFTHIADVNLVGRAAFKMAPKDIPPPMVRVFKTQPPTVIDQEQAEIEIIDQKAGPEGLILNYSATFPLAQIQVGLGKNKIPATIFGNRHRLGGMPPFLDKMIEPGLQALEKAGQGKGNVAGHIQQATKYRVLKLAVVQALAGRGDLERYLVERFPLALTPKTGKHIDNLLDKAFLHITRYPRMKAVFGGMLLSPLISFGAYSLPIRNIAIKATAQPMAGWVFDAIIPLMSLAFTFMATRYVSGRALQLSLPSLFNEAMEEAYKQATEMPQETGQGMSGAVLLADTDEDEEEAEAGETKGKSGSLFLLALIGVPLLSFAGMIGAIYYGGVQPDWLPMIQHYLPIQLPPPPVPPVSAY